MLDVRRALIPGGAVGRLQPESGGKEGEHGKVMSADL